MSTGAYPRRVDGYCGDSRCSAAQVEFLLSVMPVGGSLLEVGSASGTTAAIVADAMPSGRIVCVDTFAGMDVYLEVALRLMDWRRNQRPNMALWLGDLRALQSWLKPEERFDVAFVDADHTFQCTHECLLIASGMVKPGGAIVVHDWLDPQWPEVEPAVRAFAGVHGWGVAREAEHICMLEKSH